MIKAYGNYSGYAPSGHILTMAEQLQRMNDNHIIPNFGKEQVHRNRAGGPFFTTVTQRSQSLLTAHRQTRQHA